VQIKQEERELSDGNSESRGGLDKMKIWSWKESQVRKNKKEDLAVHLPPLSLHLASIV
jgi:hypothetical protein